MLTAACNLSEGRDRDRLDRLAAAAGTALLDVHTDPHHHRSVFTLGGDDLEESVFDLARTGLELLDLRDHQGVHPRLGVVDVVPFTPFPPFVALAGGAGEALEPAALGEALAARERFVRRACEELRLPCYRYGPERSLPEIRRAARAGLAPDCGGEHPDPRHGACCVGARGALVAYNLVLAGAELGLARAIAAAIRSPSLRALGLAVGTAVQVSCNLVAPLELGPAQAYDLVRRLAEAAGARVARAELVGLLPEAVLALIPPQRYDELGCTPQATIEHRLDAAGHLRGAG